MVIRPGRALYPPEALERKFSRRMMKETRSLSRTPIAGGGVAKVAETKVQAGPFDRHSLPNEFDSSRQRRLSSRGCFCSTTLGEFYSQRPVDLLFHVVDRNRFDHIAGYVQFLGP